MPFTTIKTDSKSVNLADSVHLLGNLSITINSIPADKYHVLHIVFSSPLVDALFDDGPNQGESIKLMKI